jgi:uncharacterized protein (UPF0548 family)
MFSFRRPAEAAIRQSIENARELPLNYGFAFKTEGHSDLPVVPHGYERDHTRSEIGQGALAFEAAREAFRQWKQFDLGWVRVANAEARIEVEEMVAVEAHTPSFSGLGLWSVNCSRILYVIDEIDRFGFGYGTTAQHVERGEERFLLEFYPVSGVVAYDLLAISQPAHWLARLGYPYTRNRQKKFARDSHARMRQNAQSLA